jgi:acetolactate synthase-1/2/3 large subunit
MPTFQKKRVNNSKFASLTRSAALWARSMGIPGVRINLPGELSAERLNLLLSRRLPVVLDMRIDPNVRLNGAGRVEALQHMSAPPSAS